MSNTLLVTTGLRFDRNKDEKILFAGDWCYYDEPKRRNIPDSETLEYPFDSAAVELANREINGVYNRLLANLMEVFNYEFKLDKDIRYYRIVLGLWLYHFLHGIYEKRRIIQAAIDRHGKVRVHTCGKTAYVTPDSFLYDIRSYGSHEFNFMLYSGILEHFNNVEKTYVRRNNEFEQMPFEKASIRAVSGRIMQEILAAIAKVVDGRMILVTSPNYGRNALYNVMYLFVKSKCRIVHTGAFPAVTGDYVGADLGLREKLRDSLVQKNAALSSQLGSIAADLLFDFIPAIFIEGFTGLRMAAIKWKRKHAEIDAFFTCNGMHTDDLFKLIVAETPEAGLGLSQHGSGYGMGKIVTAEEYEMSFADRFYTWGWGERVLPHPKLLKRPTAHYLDNSEVLFTFPTIPVYVGLMWSYYIATQYETVMKKTSSFLTSVSDSVRKNIVLRQRRSNEWRMYRPPMDLRNDTVPQFNDSLFRSRIHVSNHFGTPALESLAMEHPTIILYNSEIETIREEAKPYFDRLMEVGILFTDPVLAARHLESIYLSPNDWWLRNDVQAALKSFNFRFARADRNWRDVWLKELLDLKRKG